MYRRERFLACTKHRLKAGAIAAAVLEINTSTFSALVTFRHALIVLASPKLPSDYIFIIPDNGIMHEMNAFSYTESAQWRHLIFIT